MCNFVGILFTIVVNSQSGAQIIAPPVFAIILNCAPEAINIVARFPKGEVKVQQFSTE
jgi:hypothetical protein